MQSETCSSHPFTTNSLICNQLADFHRLVSLQQCICYCCVLAHKFSSQTSLPLADNEKGLNQLLSMSTKLKIWSLQQDIANCRQAIDNQRTSNWFEQRQPKRLMSTTILLHMVVLCIIIWILFLFIIFSYAVRSTNAGLVIWPTAILTCVLLTTCVKYQTWNVNMGVTVNEGWFEISIGCAFQWFRCVWFVAIGVQNVHVLMVFFLLFFYTYLVYDFMINK